MTPQQIIEKSIRRGAAQVRALALAEGGLALVLFAGAFLLIEIGLDHAFTLAAGMRALLLAFLAAGTATLAASMVVLPLVHSVSSLYVAYRIEAAFPHFRNSLVTFVQLRKSQPSSEIAPLVAIQAARGLEGVDIAAGLDNSRFTRLGYGVVALVVAAALYGAVVPKSMWVSMLRAMHPWADIPASTRIRISDVEPGSVRVPVGTSVAVSAKVTGADPESVTLRWSRDGELWQGLPMRRSSGRWAGTLDHVETSVLYAIRADDASSQKYTVAALAPPVVESLSVRVEPPGYTGQPAFDVSGGNIRAAEGSTARVAVRSNKELARAELRFGKAKPVALAPSGNTATGAFRMEVSGRYVIALEDVDGLAPANAMGYEVTVIADAPPEVAVAGPPDDKPVGIDDACDFAFSGRDDYGVTKFVLHYESDPSNADAKSFAVKPVSRTASGGERHTARDLGARAGDTVSFYVEAFDNREGRANSARSPIHTFQVAGPEPVPVGAAEAAPDKSAREAAAVAQGEKGRTPPGAPPGKQGDRQSPPAEGTQVAMAKDRLREMMEKDRDAWRAIMKSQPNAQDFQVGDGQPVQSPRGAQANDSGQDGQQQAATRDGPAQGQQTASPSQASGKPEAQANDGSQGGQRQSASEEGSEQDQQKADAPEAAGAPARDAAKDREEEPPSGDEEKSEMPSPPGSESSKQGGRIGPSGAKPPDGKAQQASTGQAQGSQTSSGGQPKASGAQAGGSGKRQGEPSQSASPGGAQTERGGMQQPAQKGGLSMSSSGEEGESRGQAQTEKSKGTSGSDGVTSSGATSASIGSGPGGPRPDARGGPEAGDAPGKGGRRTPAPEVDERIYATREAVRRIGGELASGRTDPALLKDLGWTPSQLRTFVEKYQTLLDRIDMAQFGESPAVTIEGSPAPGAVVAGDRGAEAVGAVDSGGAGGEEKAGGDMPREEVAPEYRTIVDEYYRSLAEGKR